MKKTKTKLLAIRVEEKDLRQLEVEAKKEKLATSSFARYLIFKSLQPRHAELKEKQHERL